VFQVPVMSKVPPPAAGPCLSPVISPGWILTTLCLVLATVWTAFPAAAAEPSAPPGFGRDVSRRLGVGMVSPEAPLGGRYLFDPRLGLELGAGVDRLNGHSTTVVLDAGLLMALAPGDRINFYFRPGARFRSVDPSDEGATTTISFTASLNVEVFVTRDFSVTADQGFEMDFVSPPSGPDHTDFAVRGAPWTRLGFFYYLGAP
jgi:hypothetical protein